MKTLFNINTLLLILCFEVSFICGCSSKNDDDIQIQLVSSDPEENAVIGTERESVILVFNKDVSVADRGKITLNGSVVPSASASGTSLNVTVNSLASGTDYTLLIGIGAIKDGSNNLNKESFSLNFKTDGNGNPPDETIRCEAENAVLSGGGTNPPQIVNAPECSGGKYVDTREGNLKFSFVISQAGNYKITAKVKAPDYKVNKFRFDGEHTIDVEFHNSAFEEVTIIDPYYFATGNHTVEMLKNWGWMQFDYLEISPSSAVPVEFNIQPLVTPQPSPNTAALYQFMLDNFQSKIISGVMTSKGLSTTTGKDQNEAVWVSQQTGKNPALIGLDFIDHTRSWKNNPDIIKDAITWKNKRGIVTFSWHWRDPLRKNDEFYTEKTNFDARKIFEPQSEDYAAMMSDMDIIAGYLKELEAEDVPVLWRPLHEAAGAWFWWGAKGTEACKQIWKIMFEKFTNEHGLKNLIWVWTSDASSDALNWYPGDEYVDIIGLDIYDEGNHGSQMLTFEELKRIYNGKKMLALSECGSIPSMAKMKKDRAIWSFYMPWCGEMTKEAKWNTVNDWKTSLQDPDVISLEDMP
jgi:mannan endo-1,4-beta-mannosidase